MANTWFLPLMVAAFLCAVLPAQSQTTLPEGPGKHTVETLCVQCHELSTVTRAAIANRAGATICR